MTQNVQERAEPAARSAHSADTAAPSGAELATLIGGPAAAAETSPTAMLGRGVILTCEMLERLATSTTPQVIFAPDAHKAMARSRQILDNARERGESIYGLTTGFGPLVKYAADSDANAQGAGLIAHLGAGFGQSADPLIVRASMLLRAHAIGLGMSAIDPAAADALVKLLAAGICPSVPEIGSVGASGDLIPLSHIARVLMGEGEVLLNGAPCPAAPALAAAGIKPITLSGRDALAIVNGTSFMSAYAALALARAERLVLRAEMISGWIYRLLGSRLQALDERLHKARGHAGQVTSAANIRREATRFDETEDDSRPLQEVYSIRCAPQVLGACRDQLDHARMLIEREINGVNDNPVVWGEPEATDFTDASVLHGGNFQGQQISFACDVINTALVQAGVIAERQADVLLNPEFNGGGPLLLAWAPGATSGMAGAQITATSLVAEMRHHALPSACSSIPTNGRNQDVVSMGTMSARAAFGQAERLSGVLAITSLAAAQLDYLRREGRAPGRTTPNPDWMPKFEGLKRDRPLVHDIRKISSAWLSA
jgi:tyrosine ammonia-lyase